LRLLLDTHALLWWLTDDLRLKRAERAAVADSDAMVHVSAASVWEIAIKASLGKIELDGVDLEGELTANDFIELPVQWGHAMAAGRLPRHHDDPFDRLLIAQAQVEGLVVVSYDSTFRKYGISLLPS
jgi:PIN domain nuclease of toxin-antitoxin system